MASGKTVRKGRAPADAAVQLLELYYPIHYQAGIGVEDALRGNDLSRHQVAILWLIHSQGDGGVRMNRKAIVQALENWFEISNAAITKAVRGMSRPPLGLVSLNEDPRSGREQIVTLTGKGERHLEAMIGRGTAYVQWIIDQMDERQIVEGIAFFEKIRDVVRTRALRRPQRR
jgi:DNA-binding MarR family transcriptional regulator